ncbi:iron-containing alcohol dehydrogenase [Candidatus Pelagibacter bacterium]|nr:iron-containing alcohol dehydrogenase [Candidatus Pelagibacter bacterium]MDA8844170.1 iron-containing alcohol dehydrogenase [Candidatus Pelagibacter bacterium]
MNSNWNYPTTMWVGKDRVKDLSIACKTLNINKPLLVTDSGLAKSKIVINVLNNLKENGITAELYSDVVGNPTGTNVNEGVDSYKKNNCDGVIAFGGGSGLDVGKAIAFMSGQNLPIWDFEDVGDNWTKANSDKIAPIIAVPTTAGTGSETGRASVILNEETGVKNIIFHPKFLPSIVILDPVLTVGLPAKMTAATGMDALAHNLEAYCAPGYHPMADGIANPDIKETEKLKKIISTDYYSTEVSDDLTGIELSGAIKNIYSMLIGASEGLSNSKAPKEIQSKYYLNTSASLIHRSISEMVEFVSFYGGRPETVYGLAGLGDLYVSAIGGRNSLMGKYLGEGYLYKEAKEKFMKNITVEGAQLALEIGPKILQDLNSKHFPLMFSMLNTICDNKKLEIQW